MSGSAAYRKTVACLSVRALYSLFVLVILVLAIAMPSKVSASTKVTNKDMRSFFNKSCFIGNSVMVGRMNYVKSYSKKYMRRALAFARVSYSFANDRNMNHGFMIKYRGVEMRAKTAVKKSGRKYVFIGTGTNDLFSGVYTTFKNYKSFIYGIKKKNPKAVIFIESLTPIRRGRASLTNKNIRSLNKKLKKYARTHKRVYYIDVSSVLRDKTGRLKAGYSSDNYVHMTSAGYAAWNRQTVKYVRKMLRLQKQKKWDYLRGGKKTVKKKAVSKAKKSIKKVKRKKISKWDPKKKKLYWSTGAKVRSIAFYKRKFYAMNKNGAYMPKKTRKLRARTKFTKDVKPLRKILGKPVKSVYKESCYDPDGNGKDGILTYKLFKLLTYRDAKGHEILLEVESRY